MKKSLSYARLLSCIVVAMALLSGPLLAHSQCPKVFVANNPGGSVPGNETVAYFDVGNPPEPPQSIHYVDVNHPVALAIADNRWVCACDPIDNFVSIVDANNPSAPVTIVPVGNTPTAIAIAANTLACVCNNGTNTVSIFDATSPSPAVTTVTVGNRPTAIAIALNKYACVCNATDGTVSVFDATNPPAGTAPTITVGTNPVAIAMALDTLACVCNQVDNTVSLFDVTDLSSTPTTVNVGNTPSAIAIALGCAILPTITSPSLT